MDGQSRARGVGGGADGPAMVEPVSAPERRGGLREPSTSNFSGVHCNMQQMGLYEKFPSDTPILVEFKKYLVEHLEVPNCQQEFLDAHYLYMRPDCVRENVDDDGKFFISLKGRPIRSASNDLSVFMPSVIATRAFVKGAVISDYHGELVTAEEGRKILESSTDEMGYLYFFTSGSQQLCINAQTHPCRCHPTMETMGRKMNHSKNNLNVKPQHCKIKFPEGEKDTLLLVAARDISVDEELCFDYGVNRKSFRGHTVPAHNLCRTQMRNNRARQQHSHSQPVTHVPTSRCPQSQVRSEGERDEEAATSIQETPSLPKLKKAAKKLFKGSGKGSFMRNITFPDSVCKDCN
ncbi:hypothetical protein Q5P01_000510 [Channa striata]|uniref:SET domain-containing protein n=1 Tax=Channa striata TaxID=64152 RepID=A0AA88IXC9_CHASR|nr:hypothetical protein Q5P01_000510 [Channa striata]